MDDKTVKIILIVVAAIVAVFFCGGILLIGFVFAFRGQAHVMTGSAPADVTPGVKEGEGYLKKRLVTEAQGFAPLVGLSTADQGRDGIRELVVVGESSAAIFDQQWRGLKAVTFGGAAQIATIVPIDAQPDGVIEFLCQNGNSGGPLFLNSEGSPVEFAVKHGEYTGAEVADVDGDGRVEILFGSFQDGNLRLYDLSGRQLWAQDIQDLAGFDFVDLPGGGRVVVSLDDEGNCSIRDPRTGQVIHPTEGKGFLSDLRPVRWIGDTGRSHFLLTGDDFVVIDSEGKRTATIPSFDPDDFPLGAYGSSVKLGPAEPELFAIALVCEEADVLCLVDATGKRHYAEVLDDVPVDVVGTGEHLYVAMEGGVWDYTLAAGSGVTAEDTDGDLPRVAGNN